MKFNTRRKLTLVCSILPVLFLLIFMFTADYIIENDYITVMFAIIVIAIILGIGSPFFFTKCPHCDLPILPFSLLKKIDKCPYCSKSLDEEIEEVQK